MVLFGDLRKLVYLFMDELERRGAVTMQYISDGFGRKAHVNLNGYRFTMRRVNLKVLSDEIKRAVEKRYGKLELHEVLGNYKMWYSYGCVLFENIFRKVDNGKVLEVFEAEAIRK